MVAKYSKNDFYWSELNTENCYYAGFIAADGYVQSDYKQGYSLQIKLAEKDNTILEQLRTALQYTGPIHSLDGYCKTIKGREVTCQPQNRLMIYNARQYIYDLSRWFNIVNNKSLTLQPPNIINTEHIKAYIVGYIDGDGCIGIYSEGKNKSKHARLTVVGSEVFLNWIKNQLPCNSYLMKCSQTDQIKQLVVKGKQFFYFYDWAMSVTVPRLERKWNIAA